MWKENYDTYFLLFADAEKVLINPKTDQQLKRVRCSPGEVPDWIETDE